VVGAKSGFSSLGSSWENGYCESLKTLFRDELLNSEVFNTLREAQIPIERWRRGLVMFLTRPSCAHSHLS
jgi:transposase InsO family protein